MRHSVDAWISVVRTSGTAGDDEIAAAAEVARAQFAPDATTGGSNGATG